MKLRRAVSAGARSDPSTGRFRTSAVNHRLPSLNGVRPDAEEKTYFSHRIAIFSETIQLLQLNVRSAPEIDDIIEPVSSCKDANAMTETLVN